MNDEYMQLPARLEQYIDNNFGSDTKVERSFSPTRDAIEWTTVTTIKNKKYRFDYYYPFWDMVEHKEISRIDYSADLDDYDVEPMFDELKLVCKRAFGWRHLYLPPDDGDAFIIDINGGRTKPVSRSTIL